MRLFTHNFLQCHVKGCNTNNYPLKFLSSKNQGIEDGVDGNHTIEIEYKDMEYNPEFIRSYINKINLPALQKAVQDLELDMIIPDELNIEDEETVKMLHKILFETFIKNGKMKCLGCDHIYPIRDGIPNMLLAEDEV